MRMYTTYNRLPRIRMEAVRLVKSGWSVREVARHISASLTALLLSGWQEPISFLKTPN